MLEITGVPTEEQVEDIKPAKDRLSKGPVAVIECFQKIPCDPCYTACNRDAIQPFEDINELPTINNDNCNGCGICVAYCPGLAIFVIDETYSNTEALIKIPWEFLNLPKEGEIVPGINREGEEAASVTVKKVQPSPKKNGAYVLWLSVPKELAFEIRSIPVK